MKDDFVIDENIVINAWRGEDAAHQRAHNERIFLHAFIPTEKKLHCTVSIQTKYRKIETMKLKTEKYVDAGIKKWFLDRLLNPQLCPIVDGLKIPKYKHIKDDDAEFVHLAITKDGNLITVDKRMKDEIHDEGLDDDVKYFDVADSISLIVPSST